MLLSFWATWCKPCQKEVPLLEAVARRYQGERLQVVALNHGEGRDVVRRFVRSNEALTMTVAYDHRGEVSDRFEIQVLPTLILLDPQDRVVFRASGYTEAGFQALLEQVHTIAAVDVSAPPQQSSE